jgi:hypothetical protein
MTSTADSDMVRPISSAKKYKGPIPVIADIKADLKLSATPATAAPTKAAEPDPAPPPARSAPKLATPHIPSPVQMAMVAGQADAQDALAKLRDLLVGPTQQLNEARLEELVNLFDERENDLRNAMRDMQKRNAELEVALKQSDIESSQKLKTEMLAVTDSLAAEMKKTFSSLREELAVLRSEAHSLFAASKEFAVERIATLESRTSATIDSKNEKIKGEVAAVSHALELKIRDEAKASQHTFSRVLKEASEGLNRLANAKD